SGGGCAGGTRLGRPLGAGPGVPLGGVFGQRGAARGEPKPSQRPSPPLWIGANGPLALRRAVRLGNGFFGAGSTPTARFAEQVQVVRETLATEGGTAADFPIAKRVYVAIDEDAGRARRRMNDAMQRLYGRRAADIEAAAVAGTPADCVAALREVVAAGAGTVPFTALFYPAGHARRPAAGVIP